MEVAAPVGGGFPAPFLTDSGAGIDLPTDLGERTEGPLRLRGYAQEAMGPGRAEYWVYEYPRVRSDPLAYPPIPIESTFSMNAGQRLETRATSVRRVPLEPDTFAVPDPIFDGAPGE